MEEKLNEYQIRVLGSLVEKHLQTPEYYPLSMNALVAACNQKSSRDPVMNLEEFMVQSAVNGLKNKGLALRLATAIGRVPKYEHGLITRWQFDNPELAVLGVLFLRGPQTLGEIKARTARMVEFKTLQEVADVLEKLQNNDNGPFAVQMPREPGRKESRYRHCFGMDEPDAAEVPQGKITQAAADASAKPAFSSEERLRRLEEKVQQLSREVADLKKRL